MKAVVLALSLASLTFSTGCATTSGNGGENEAEVLLEDAAAKSVSAKLGISTDLVQFGFQTAHHRLTNSKTPIDKQRAGQLGAEAAFDKAQREGKPLSNDQKEGLSFALKELL